MITVFLFGLWQNWNTLVKNIGIVYGHEEPFIVNDIFIQH